jgi:TM2 domain-containing membrane protein YozV
MKRMTDHNTIEQRLLDLAYTTDARITSPTLAYFAPCSLEDAEQVLENLAARNRITMEVDEAGTVVYHVPDRQKLQPRIEPSPQHAMATITPATPFAIRGGRQASPGLAAFFSLLLPGAGQAYAGRFVSAILWFIFVSLGYTLILPGLFLHMLCIASAAGSAYRLNSNLARYQLSA